MAFDNLAQVIGSVGATPATIESAFEAALGDQSFADTLLALMKESGTATIANGTTSIAVTHGLGSTPTADQIMVNPIETLGTASFFWVDTITATQFTINVNADPGADVDFAWRADKL